jgi:hypothetical protein
MPQESDPTGRLAEIHVEKMVRRMKYDWRQQTDKSRGVDGLIEIYRKGVPTGRFIFVQVKSGLGHLRKTKSKTHYSIRVDAKDVEYWRRFNIPVILVWYNIGADRAYWAQIDINSVSQGGWQVRLSKKCVFGLHSAGDLYQLCRTYYGIEDQLPVVQAPTTPKVTVNDVKETAFRFYDEWRKEHFITPAYGRVRISLRGWRHITAAWRTQRHIVGRLELLGAARQIMLTVPTKHKCREIVKERRVFFMQTAVVQYLHRGNAVVSVITEQYGDAPPTFYSVFEHRTRPKGGDAVHQSLLGATAR